MAATPISLDQLIELVRAQHPDGDALERLTDAMLLSTRLNDHADHLIGHFVDQARASGASWSQIGAAMGVSKQAAQQRWVPRGAPDSLGSRLGSRFTPRAMNVVEYAIRLAAGNGADHVGTEHVVLALFSEPNGVAAKALAECGVTAEDAGAALGLDDERAGPATHLPLDDSTAAMFERTLREALKLGHNYLGTEHILLSIVASDLPVTAKLAELGLTTETVAPPIERLLMEITQARQTTAAAVRGGIE